MYNLPREVDRQIILCCYEWNALQFICSESVLLPLLPVTTTGAPKQAQKLGLCRGKMKRRLEAQSNGCRRQSNDSSSALQASFCVTDLITEEYHHKQMFARISNICAKNCFHTASLMFI
jgi:hypothetical protein